MRRVAFRSFWSGYIFDKWLLNIVYIIIFISQSTTSLAQISYVDPKEIGHYIAEQIAKKGGKTYLNQRIELAQKFRKKMIEESLMFKGLAQMKWVDKKIFIESTLASTPLVDTQRALITNSTSAARLLFSIYSAEGNSSALVDKISLPEELDKLIEATLHLTAPAIEDPYFRKLEQTLKIADPIVKWLLTKPKFSVSHIELLRHSTELLDGDVLTAVGVLGELFYQETLNVKNRKTQAILASKLKPLINGNLEFNVGHNYHFWRTVSASLFKRSTFLGRAYGYIDNPEPTYRSANKVGFDVADYVLFEIKSSLSSYCSILFRSLF
jgi:hypothetical protein